MNLTNKGTEKPTTTGLPAKMTCKPRVTNSTCLIPASGRHASGEAEEGVQRV